MRAIIVVREKLVFLPSVSHKRWHQNPLGALQTEEAFREAAVVEEQSKLLLVAGSRFPSTALALLWLGLWFISLLLLYLLLHGSLLLGRLGLGLLRGSRLLGWFFAVRFLDLRSSLRLTSALLRSSWLLGGLLLVFVLGFGCRLCFASALLRSGGLCNRLVAVLILDFGSGLGSASAFLCGRLSRRIFSSSLRFGLLRLPGLLRWRSVLWLTFLLCCFLASALLRRWLPVVFVGVLSLATTLLRGFLLLARRLITIIVVVLSEVSEVSVDELQVITHPLLLHWRLDKHALTLLTGVAIALKILQSVSKLPRYKLQP